MNPDVRKLPAILSEILTMRTHAVGSDERCAEFQAYKRAACDFITVYGDELEAALAAQDADDTVDWEQALDRATDRIVAAKDATPAAPESDVIEASARYGWQHSSCEWQAVKGSLDRFTTPRGPGRRDSALLDFMQRRRVALTPEFEGEWFAEIFDDEGEVVSRHSGDSPRAALHAASGGEVSNG